MGLARRVQILAKKETTEGSNANPAATDAIKVFNPTIQETYDVADRQAAGQSVDREVTPPGRSSRQITFEHDFVGSGVAADTPPWGKLLQGACMTEEDQHVLELTSTPPMTGIGFQPGEVVNTGSTDHRGIVLNRVTHASGTPSGNLHVCWFKGTAPIAGDTITGESSGSVAEVALAGVSTVNKVYRPDSRYTVRLTLGAWAASAPALGTVIVFSTGSASKGAGQVIQDDSAGAFTDILVAMQWGTVANGDTASHTGGSATVNAAPTLENCPSLTFRYNLDGMVRDMVGARGDFVLSGEAGQSARFAFTYTGVVDLHTDALFASGFSMPTTVAPRLIAVESGISVGNQYLKLPLKRFELAYSNSVALDADATAAKGDRAAIVSDRDPTLTVVVNKIGTGTANWIQGLQIATTYRWGILIGSSAGNKVLVAVSRAQLVSIADGDADGVATDELTFKCRRVEEKGDDSVCIAQLGA